MTHQRNFFSHYSALLSSLALISATAAYSPICNAAPTAATISVDASNVLNRIPATQEGVNTAVWDGYLTDSNTVPLLKTAGIRMLRYPGGSESDDYNWFNNTSISGGFTWSGADFDQFMKATHPVTAAAILVWQLLGLNIQM
jgi:hypothetical protein